MNTFTCWMRRAVGLALALAVFAIDVYAQPGRAEIKGQVIGNRPGEDSPRGLPGVTVALRHPSGKPLAGNVPFEIPKTGEDGKFALDDIPAGEYLLRFTANGYDTHETKIFCSPHGLTQLTVRLERSAPGQKITPRDPLPGADKIAWDVKVFEASPLFEVVRREVKGRKVIWLLENAEDNPGGILFHRAVFVDADGVTIRTVDVKTDSSNWRSGERNRFILTIPEMEDMEKTSRVVLSRSF